MGTADLTGDDLALSVFGVGHMINWWKAQPASRLRKKELAKCEELLKKLNAVLDDSFSLPPDEIDD